MIALPIKNFIQRYSDYINNPDMHRELAQYAMEELSGNNQAQLFKMFKDIGLDFDSIRWEKFESNFHDALMRYVHVPYPIEDRSGSWSRLYYLLEEVGLCGFTYDEVVEYLKQPEIQKRLGITLTPLEAGYGWYGSGDYDLGWFKKDVFREEFPEEFEE